MSEAAQVMKKGSVSFYLASRILPTRVREAILLLYQWCRFCDDVVDGQDLGHGSGAPSQDVEGLLTRTTAGVEGRAGDPVFGGMGKIVREHQIPLFYAEALLQGMQMDAEGVRYPDFDSLKLYCYRVAGTVGLMFTHISGAGNADARRNAADLGMAMQLTNIARDVAEDFKRGRVYLPESWLREEGVEARRLIDLSQRSGLVRVVKRMLGEADALYKSGDAGLAALPWRVAFAVASARHIYAEIGAEVRAREGAAWDERVVVPLGRKLTLVFKAFCQVAATFPQRLVKPWKAVALPGEWRPL